MRNSFSIWIQRQWQHHGFCQLALIPISWLFWLISTSRRKAYAWGLLKSYRAPVPVIVVGNLSVGGAGKTPLVIWLMEQLKEAGFTPGVVSRGYGRARTGVAPVGALSLPADVGDEPLLIHKRTQCPVWVGADRAAACRDLLRSHPDCDVIVSDDGMQHYRIQRDIELVVIDAERGFGNGQLLPAGPLREPMSRLKDVDAIIYNGEVASGSGYTMRLRPGKVTNLSDGETLASLDIWHGMKVYAVAGIGNPMRFFRQLKELGLDVESRAFSDHHAYAPEDLAFAENNPLLMTEKDAVKCRGFAKPSWWYLPVEAELDDGLLTEVVSKLRK